MKTIAEAMKQLRTRFSRPRYSYTTQHRRIICDNSNTYSLASLGRCKSHNAPQAASCRSSQCPCTFQLPLLLPLCLRRSSSRSCGETITQIL